MAKRKPLFQTAGQVEELPATDHTDLGGILNLGPSFSVTAATTITFEKTNTIFLNPGGTQNVDQINGGNDGDVLVLRKFAAAGAVRVRTDEGNLVLFKDRKIILGSDVLTLLNIGGTWVEISWSG